ncbi:hypothetical protein [Nocardia sp. XZ_19_369]|uniref:DUF6881 domain-containing protein n=1 Tax=Nocardia sp. XZ_19_369 TaxID=2769487 RepID=UPI0018907542|nr:hypothetical protein [Nocardia sp. XZ_19_369]
MRYVKVIWHHNFDDEPLYYLHEVGDDNYETRRVQIYRDGHREWADENHETATAGLAEIPIAPVDEIASHPEFDAAEIARDEFETEWSRAQ